MRTKSREFLAVVVFGSKSRIGDRIEMLLRRHRTFSLRASRAGVVASAVVLGGLMLAGSLAPHWIAFAQEGPRAAFDVASIRQKKGASLLVHMQPSPGGRLTVENVPLRFLMQQSFDVEHFQILGGPDWLKTDRYDIEAKAEGNPTGKQRLGPMLQAVLEDRFKLRFHRETRQLPVYALTAVKSGSKLPASKEGSCTPWSQYSLSTISSRLPAPGQKPPTFCGFLGFGVQGLDSTLDMAGASMAELTASLSYALPYSVIDKTGLAGTFEVHLKWTPDTRAVFDPIAAAPPADASRPTLFTALQEQLGLKLESEKGPVEVVVIDHMERPDAN